MFVSDRWLPEMGLLVFGSRAEYEALLRLPEGRNPGRFVAPFRPILDSARVRARTVAENEMELTEAIQQLPSIKSLPQEVKQKPYGDSERMNELFGEFAGRS